MKDPWERLRGDFEGLADEYYPGSRQKRSSPLQRPPGGSEAVSEESWDAHPKTYKLGGQPREFFTIRAVAMALGRQPVTIRKWIRLGYMPDARYRSPKVAGTLAKGRTETHGRPSGTTGSKEGEGRRLWTREQIEAMIRIAAEVGFYPAPAPNSVHFRLFSEQIWAHNRSTS